MPAPSAWDLADQAAGAIAQLAHVDHHDVAVVLGSGWAPAADRLGEPAVEVPLTDVPGFAPTGVAGHVGVARSIELDGGRRALAFLGRIHAYEGHDLAQVVHGVRTAARAGCSTLVLTNAAGGLREGFEVGQPVLIADHLNLTGRSPLTGAAAPEGLGVPRFVDLTDAYSPRLRSAARDLDPALTEGVYAGLPGPHYETPAEIRMLRTLGADLVGMSTVHEVIAARHLGLEVLAVSLVTNLAAGLGGEPGGEAGGEAGGGLDHTAVVAAGQAAASAVGDLLAAVLDRL